WFGLAFLSGGLPLARIAVAEIAESEIPEGRQRQGPAKRREVKDVGDHPTVGERLGRIAGRVDERDVLIASTPRFLELAHERGSGIGEAGLHAGNAVVI